MIFKALELKLPASVIGVGATLAGPKLIVLVQRAQPLSHRLQVDKTVAGAGDCTLKLEVA